MPIFRRGMVCEAIWFVCVNRVYDFGCNEIGQMGHLVALIHIYWEEDLRLKANFDLRS